MIKRTGTKITGNIKTSMEKQKKKGFSLVEVMILFTVLAVILAASMPLISKKSRPVPRKYSHGVYMCVALNEPVIKEGKKYEYIQRLFTGTRLSEEKEVKSCSFKVPEAAMYKVDLYSAGAGGNIAAKIITKLDDFRSATYSLGADGLSDLGEYTDGSFDQDTFEENSLATPIDSLSSQEIADNFLGDYIIRSAKTLSAGFGGKGVMEYFYPRGSYCTAQHDLADLARVQHSAAVANSNKDINALMQAQADYEALRDAVTDYKNFLSDFLTSNSATKLENIKTAMGDAKNDINACVATGAVSYQCLLDFKNKANDKSYKDYIDLFSSKLGDLADQLQKDLYNIPGYAATINNKINEIITGADSGTGDKYAYLQSSINSEAASGYSDIKDSMQEAIKKYVDNKQIEYANNKVFECERDNEGDPEAYKACSEDTEQYEKWKQEGYDNHHQEWEAEGAEAVQSKYDTESGYKTKIRNKKINEAYQTWKTTQISNGTIDTNYFIHFVIEPTNVEAGIPTIQNYDNIEPNKAWEFNTFYETKYTSYITDLIAIADAKITEANNMDKIKKKILNDTLTGGTEEGENYDITTYRYTSTYSTTTYGNSYPTLKTELVNWKEKAKILNESVPTIKKDDATLLFASTDITSQTITESNWANYVSTALSYYQGRVSKYNDEYKKVDEYWHGTLKENGTREGNGRIDALTKIYNTIAGGSLENYLHYIVNEMDVDHGFSVKGRPRFLYDDWSSFDLRNPTGNYGDGVMALKKDSNTYKQLKTFCRANNIKMFMQTYEEWIHRIAEDKDGALETQYRNSISNPSPTDEEVSAGVEKLAFEKLLSMTTLQLIEQYSKLTDIDTSNLPRKNETLGTLFNDYWNNPMTLNATNSAGELYLNSLTTGFGGMGGQGGFLRIKYPLTYLEKYNSDAPRYSGAGGKTVSTLKDYVAELSDMNSPEGRYMVACHKDLASQMADSNTYGYYEVPVTDGDVAGAKETSDNLCIPLTYSNEITIYSDYFSKQNALVPNVYGHYFKYADRYGSNKVFGDQETRTHETSYETTDESGNTVTKTRQSNHKVRLLKTHKGIDLKEIDYPFYAWHIPVHGGADPYTITAFRNVSLVRGLDDLAEGGEGKIVGMEEQSDYTKYKGNDHADITYDGDYDTFKTTWKNANEEKEININTNSSLRSFVLRYNKQYTFWDIENKMFGMGNNNKRYKKDCSYINPETGSILNADNTLYDPQCYEDTPQDFAFTKYGEQAQTGRHTTFTGDEGKSADSYPAHEYVEYWINNRGQRIPYTTTIAAVTAHTPAEAETIKNSGLIATQDPQMVIRSSMWSKYYMLGYPGSPGKLKSSVESNLGKFCKIEVPVGGAPYDVTQEYDYQAVMDQYGSYNNANGEYKKLHELEDALGINMKCAKTQEDIAQNRNIVFKKTVDGGKYNLRIQSEEEATRYRWYQSGDEHPNSVSPLTYSDTFDTNNNPNTQPTWKPTSIWAKVFKKMLDPSLDIGFSPSKEGVGLGGDGTTLTDNCTVRKGFYQTMKQYKIWRFILNTDYIATIPDTNEGLSETKEVTIANDPLTTSPESETICEKDTNGNCRIKDGRNYTGDKESTYNVGHEYNCYFTDRPEADTETKQNEGPITVDLTTQDDIVKAGLYSIGANKGGGGAVVITW